MKPAEQTILTPPDGNCFAACVASILELPIEELPNYRSEGDGWWHEWQKWLAKRNLAFLGWPSDDLGDEQVRADTLRGYSIVTVRYELPSGGINHSCVALNGEMIWNPHPLRGTQQHDSIQDWIIFRVLDPAKPLDGWNMNTSKNDSATPSTEAQKCVKEPECDSCHHSGPLNAEGFCMVDISAYVDPEGPFHGMKECLCKCEFSTEVTCRNCGHTEPHNGPAGTIDDACTHKGCECGYLEPVSTGVPAAEGGK